MSYQEKEKFWLTADKRRIPMKDMDTNHLLLAFTSVADREFRVFQQLKPLQEQIDPLVARIDKLQEVKNMLLEEMEKRQVTPIYPDQKIIPHSGYGNYFEAERKVKAMPIQKAVLSTTEHSS